MFNEKAEYRPVCVVLREILGVAEEIKNEEIISLVREAHEMTKRMDKRLKELSPRYNKKMFSKDYKNSPRKMVPIKRDKNARSK